MNQSLSLSLKGFLLVQLFLGYVFLVSGLLVNLLQFLSACFIWPFNRALYRKINYHLATIIWSRKFIQKLLIEFCLCILEMTFVYQWW
jgi:hypothetical protein